MKKSAIIMIVLISILILTGCAIRTPQINGLVLDEDTKQPVPEAWISSMITVKYATIAGNVTQYISVDPPHTRTDKGGKFIIPSRKFKGATFPFEFGNDVKHFGVDASTADDRGGSVSLMDALGNNKAEVTIYIKPEYTNFTESEHFSALQALYNYCVTGRFAVEVPAVEGGCDAWELDYAIKKHEGYLERLGELKNRDQRAHYSIALGNLANLYEKQNNYNKSLELFQKVKEYDEKREVKIWLIEYEHKIKELKKKLGQNTIK